eukprot:343377-Rhodomonas_salina.3
MLQKVDTRCQYRTGRSTLQHHTGLHLDGKDCRVVGTAHEHIRACTTQTRKRLRHCTRCGGEGVDCAEGGHIVDEVGDENPTVGGGAVKGERRLVAPD